LSREFILPADLADVFMSRPNLLIFCDWDETITAEDTLALIPNPDSSEPDAPPPFSYFSKYYLNLLAEHEKEIGPRDTLERQLEYLDSLGSVERKSVTRVEEKGLFKGVKEDDIRQRAEHVKFRDGWKRFGEELEKSAYAKFVAVISVNWSSMFIETALRRVHHDDFMRQLIIRANVVSLFSAPNERTLRWILKGRGLGRLRRATEMRYAMDLIS